MSDRKGFTLIEMLMVVVILGVMLSFALPRIDTGRYKVDAAVQSIGTTMLAAQRQAITQQHDIIVQLDVATQSLRIHEDKNNDAAIDPGERVRGIPLGENVIFGLAGANPHSMGAGPITFTKMVRGLPAVVFHRDGSASQGGGFYLTLATNDKPKLTRAVQISRATGRAQWYRYTAPTWKKVF